MSVSAFTALRHSRAAGSAAVALVVAGAASPVSRCRAASIRRSSFLGGVIARSGTLPTQTMVLDVTRPLEQAAMEVPGIRRVRSTSIRGATEVSAQFEPSMDMVVALQQLQNRVAEVRSALPADADLTVDRLTPAVFPSSASTSPAPCR